ncbi:hypothetical protein BpHYR1_039011 [Brachionus plicatilis]|uniref:Uncharacterized protein n=1 Tax=Brachionus plicatilis TaxID=10195 RepID=A0A3M7T1K5_BRAPC|nr:hypothetical protein BpHYR1_039011 [Brachionus plicatilis]
MSTEGVRSYTKGMTIRLKGQSIGINFNEKPGSASYAIRNKDKTKLLALMMIIDISMLNLIVQCTNSSIILFKFKKPKICPKSIDDNAAQILLDFSLVQKRIRLISKFF